MLQLSQIQDLLNMPTNKNQHFVPQFYLKQFSSNSSRKGINLFNLSSTKYISGASISGQAQKDYFYGRDLNIEKAFQAQEKIAPKIIKKITENNMAPAINSSDHYHLLEFVVFLRLRTACVAEQAKRSADKIIELATTKSVEFASGIREDEFPLSSLTLDALHSAVLAMPLVFDLNYKIFVNSTNIPFITSDHPVILYNQFLKNRRQGDGNIGFACKGLQILLPLSPRYLIVFFDGGVYKVGSKKNLFVSLGSNSDIESLNFLQCINANQNLYFNQDVSEPQIRKLANKSLVFRKDLSVGVEEISYNGEYLVSQVCTPEINLKVNLPSIHLVKAAKTIQVNQGEDIPVRNENLCRLYKTFLELLGMGKYKENEFYDFLEDVAQLPRQSI